MTATSESVDSLDVIDLVEAIEAAYRLKAPDSLFDGATTAGDIADRLWASLPPHVRQGGKCGSMVAFHRLKAWLAAKYPHVTWRPTTRFAAVPGFRYDQLEQAFPGVILPGVGVARANLLASATAALAVSLLALPQLLTAILIFPVVLLISVLLLHRWLRTGRPAAATLGSAAAFVAAHNLVLMREGGVTLSRKAVRRIFAQHLDDLLDARMV